MATEIRCLLPSLLRDPAAAFSLTLADWDRVIRQARHANLLARLDYLLQQVGDVGQLPEPVRRHLTSARHFSLAHARVVRWEVNRICRALNALDLPVVLLKGAAYLLADLPPAYGRVFSDVDILVPRDRLEEVEESLYWAGWLTTHHDAYDQRYYRQWMHELPPLRHVRRKTVLDVHHNILPETARLNPDPRALIEDARVLDASSSLYVLSDTDMVLHSATHLFHDGELEHGLRDLVDLDAMLRHFSEADEGFWDRLRLRAESQGLSRPLFYALQYTRIFLDTPIPGRLMEDYGDAAPGMLTRTMITPLFRRALAPDHPSCAQGFTELARGLLYIRAHYLRMPLYLLLPHLIRKALRRQEGETA